MKNRIAAISIVGNVALVAGVLWMRARDEGEIHTLSVAAMRADELHVRLHERSLVALESADPKEAAAAADLLRPIVAAGKKNIEARDRMGLER